MVDGLVEIARGVCKVVFLGPSLVMFLDPDVIHKNVMPLEAND